MLGFFFNSALHGKRIEVAAEIEDEVGLGADFKGANGDLIPGPTRWRHMATT